MIKYRSAALAFILITASLMANDSYQDFPQLGCLDDAISLSITIKDPMQSAIVEYHLLVARERILDLLSVNDHKGALDACNELYDNIGEVVADCDENLRQKITACICNMAPADYE